MSKIEVEINADQVLRMFDELTSKDRKKVFKSAIRGALNILKKRTIQNLKSVIDPTKIDYKDEYGNTFRKGIKVKTYKDGKSGVIHLFGNYKLKWFELGTKARYNKTFRGKALKKPRYTGSIKASHFFKNAKESSEEEVFNSIEKLLVRSIKRINDKYKSL